MSSETLSSADHRMARAVEAMERDFQGVRTGRASTALVDRLVIDYYGTQTPLNQLAGISVPESHQIVIQPWDRAALGAIEKARSEERRVGKEGRGGEVAGEASSQRPVWS